MVRSSTRRNARRSLVAATVAVLALVVGAFGLAGSSGAAPQADVGIAGHDPGAAPALTPAQAQAVDRLQAAAGVDVRVETDPATGAITFIGAPAGRALAGSAGDPAASAQAFLAVAAEGLGVEAGDLAVQSVEPSPGGAGVRLQQTDQGLPVIGGQVAVQLDPAGRVTSTVSDLSTARLASPVPTLGAGSAAAIAVATTAAREGLDAATLVASSPVLSVFNASLLGPGLDRAQLVWHTEVTNTRGSAAREFVVVDALNGSVPLLFSQIAEAKQREVCDDLNVRKDPDHCTAALSLRHEGGPAAADAEVNQAYDYAGATYDFYSTRFGRDSLDGAGMTLFSTVDYCDPDTTVDCPLDNAFWSGAQMHYGDTFAGADDVVGHELSHGVTDFTSGLFYYYQSGAINEALSDIFGEYIDLTDGAGTDTPAVRWEIGEDLPIGAIRDMSDPGSFGNPDRMRSPNYDPGPTDQGGVHTNSGVANKAAVLMTDGGTFNGETVSGIGIDRAAAIWYRVETAYLLSGSDYHDLGTALYQACGDLVGQGGITEATCAEVNRAVTATEMLLEPGPAATPGPDAPTCLSGTRANLFSDDLENPATGNWVAASTSANTAFHYPQNTHPYEGYDATYATSGTTNFWSYDSPEVGDATISRTGDTALPAGTPAFLRFNRAFGFEFDGAETYDGAVVEYSTNGGATWTDAGPLMTHGGYNGAIESDFGNPLAGRPAFVAESHGYGSTRIDLSSLAGSNVRFRFRLGTDDVGDGQGMFVDDIEVFTCAVESTTTTTASTTTAPTSTTGSTTTTPGSTTTAPGSTTTSSVPPTTPTTPTTAPSSTTTTSATVPSSTTTTPPTIPGTTTTSTPTGPVGSVPAAPGAPLATAADASSVHLSWTAPAGGGATSYVVRTFTPGSTTALRTDDTASTALTATLSGLPGGKVYQFTVAARNGGGTSPQSPLSVAALPPFTTVGGFVARQYEDFAGRAPTAAELARWTADLTSGAATAEAKIDRAGSFTNWGPKVDPITRLYDAFFSRPPDTGGLNHWADRRRAGRSLDAIAAAFARSHEFRATYGSLSDRAFVELVYQHVLGRPGDADGIDFWTAQLADGSRTRSRVVVGFSESGEHRTRLAATVNTVNVYDGMLGRAPTVAELLAWHGTAGASRRPVAAVVLLSNEYVAQL